MISICDSYDTKRTNSLVGVIYFSTFNENTDKEPTFLLSVAIYVKLVLFGTINSTE